MNKTKSAYPPLTLANIHALKGKPVSKMITPTKRKNAFDLEEWIYYNVTTNSKERYCFRNGRLVKYKIEEVG
jgi:DNA mismatch repair ATPase MutL